MIGCVSGRRDGRYINWLKGESRVLQSPSESIINLVESHLSAEPRDYHHFVNCALPSFRERRGSGPWLKGDAITIFVDHIHFLSQIMPFCISCQASEAILKIRSWINFPLYNSEKEKIKLEPRLDHPHPQKLSIQHLRLVLTNPVSILLEWMFSFVKEWIEWRIKYPDHLRKHLGVFQSHPTALILMSLLFQL